MTRWPVYDPAAHDKGVRAVFSFPLQIGAARLGALDIFRDGPGPLTTRAVSQAVTFCEVAMQTLLDGPSEAGAGEPAVGLDDALAYRLEIYQAHGMVMVALGVPLVEAMARMRAHADAADRPLSDVARDIVARELTLHRDPPTPAGERPRSCTEGADGDDRR